MTATSDLTAQVLPSSALYIGDQQVTSASGGRMERLNPTTGEVLQDFPVAGVAEVDAAVRTAHHAFPAWRALGADKRREILWTIGEGIRKESESLKTLVALETGTPVGVNSFEMATDFFQYYAGYADKVNGEVTHTYGHNALDYTRREPYGVIGALITWNGTIASSAMKLAPALAAGNCVVLKSSELGPFGPMRLAQICLDAGLPPGVVNVISGAAETGAALIRHELVRKVSFTGGPSTARKILATAADSLTPVVLELGGKSASIVFPDADLERAVGMTTSMSTIATSGQGCLYPTRLLAHVDVYDEVVEIARQVAGAAVIGNPLDPTVQMGPVINGSAVDRILGYIDGASAESRLVIGGARLGGGLESGYFVPPTVLADVRPGSTLAQEEVFGPVLAIMPFTTEDEAISTANSTQYGLSAFVHTRDLARAHRVADAMDAGYVSVNAFPPMTATAPFGGVKQSGFGSEGGSAGIEEYLHHKNIYVSLDD